MTSIAVYPCQAFFGHPNNAPQPGDAGATRYSLTPQCNDCNGFFSLEQFPYHCGFENIIITYVFDII